MSTDAHLAELTEQHHALEAAIEEEMKLGTSDSLRISDLKRQKLRIKDEIANLENTDEQVA